MMTINEMMLLLQAYREGKKIQWKHEGQWKDCDPAETFKFFNWRIAPESPATSDKLQPREWNVLVQGKSIIGGIETPALFCGDGQNVKVREVIE